MAKQSHNPIERRRLYTLALGALGVVYGDIGTSPLYAFRECFYGHRAVAVAGENVLGVLSLILWSLILVISVKYLLYVMRADNRGEGGILALLTLLAPGISARSRRGAAVVALGLFGAALLYGDGMITPAISVLSAIEGLKVATPVFEPYIVPISSGILVGLFLIQRKGTGVVGAVFGPITLLWFSCLSVLGLGSIARTPEVLWAMSPHYGLRFLLANDLEGFLVLGSVFLVITGGEALYADMGHFGLRPIRLAWYRVVLPALAINYFGQGALLLRQPETVSNPFYFLAPRWCLYPLVLLATLATVIASQAVISGAFSLSRQALQLGYTPRMEVRHTSPHEIGQVYVPAVNWILMAATVGLVLGFKSSSNLAGAYGVAVTTTMVITTMLALLYARRFWGWGLAATLVVTGVFLSIDLSFLGANLVKIPRGGWFPLVVAAAVYILMTTWKQGRRLLAERLSASRISMNVFLESLDRDPLTRVPGIAIFMDATPAGTPRTLLHNIKHNRVIHSEVVLLTVLTEETPRVAHQDRLEINEYRPGFLRVLAHYGYMEKPDFSQIVAELRREGKIHPHSEPTVFLGRESLIVRRTPGMSIWRKRLFGLMSRNSQQATLHFGIEPGRVVELGLQVEL